MNLNHLGKHLGSKVCIVRYDGGNDGKSGTDRVEIAL